MSPHIQDKWYTGHMVRYASEHLVKQGVCERWPWKGLQVQQNKVSCVSRISQETAMMSKCAVMEPVDFSQQHNRHLMLSFSHQTPCTQQRSFSRSRFFNIHIKEARKLAQSLCAWAQCCSKKRRGGEKNEVIKTYPKISLPSTSPALSGNASFLLMPY